MKKLSSKKCIMFFLFITSFYACTDDTIETDTDADTSVADAQITGFETTGWIYSDLIIEGLDFGTDCDNDSVSITNGSTTFALNITECSDSRITSFIPEDVDPGVYSIIASINGTEFTSIDGVNMELEVKERPVILSMSKTTVDDGETITIEGLNLLNSTGVSAYDAKVWIMGTGYTNTVSEITVDSDGNGATITIDEGIEAGEYNFLLTTDEWSNKVVITIL